MKFILLAAMAVLFGSGAQAADSSRLVCDNDQVMLHVFEHRTAEDRATDIAVIYGGYVFAGTVGDGQYFVLQPLGSEPNGNEFWGSLKVDYVNKKAKLARGMLVLQGTKIPVARNFSCKELNK